MTATTATQHQPGDRVTWTSRHTRKTYTGTVNGPFVADQIAVEQDPQPGDTQRATWHVPASQLRPLAEAATPVMLGHLRKAHRARSAKTGRFNSVARRTAVLAALAARFNRGQVTVASYLTELGADADTIRRYSATLGKHVKAAYAAKYCAEPVRSAIAVVGRRIVRAFGYDAGDVEILRGATASYARTASLIGA